MAVKSIRKIISRGEQNLQTQRLNAGCTAYEGDTYRWQGESAFVFTPTQTVTEVPSGNDPAWDVIKGAVTGDVELTVYDIPIEDLCHLLGAKYTEADGFVVGDEDDEVAFLGLSIDKLIRSGNANSINKVILHKVSFELPAIDIKTISKDDNAIAEIKLKGKAYPVYFSKTNGELGSRTYRLLNSVKNATAFLANKDAIVFPTELTPDTPAETPAETPASGTGN